MWVVEQQLGSTDLEDGTAVRFAVVGKGPVAIYVPGWVSHLELGWAVPAERQFYEGLADGRTLVRYDRPGCGLSDTTDRTDIVELELEVLAAVSTAVGVDRFDLLGASFGAPLAVRWAARHPESVSRLVLYGGWVDGDGVAAPAVREHVLGLVEEHWGLASDVLTEIFAPDADRRVPCHVLALPARIRAGRLGAPPLGSVLRHRRRRRPRADHGADRGHPPQG